MKLMSQSKVVTGKCSIRRTRTGKRKVMINRIPPLVHRPTKAKETGVATRSSRPTSRNTADKRINKKTPSVSKIRTTSGTKTTKTI